MAFNVIQSVLFEPFAGVLYKKLIETGLVDAFGKMAGTESYGKYSLFNMGKCTVYDSLLWCST